MTAAPMHSHAGQTDAPAWAEALCAALYRLACRRPAVARLIGLWIIESLEREP